MTLQHRWMSSSVNEWMVWWGQLDNDIQLAEGIQTRPECNQNSEQKQNKWTKIENKRVELANWYSEME